MANRWHGTGASLWPLGILLILGLAPASLRAASVEVVRAEGRLWVSFRVDDLFGEGVWSSLRSGLPCRIRQRASLWQRRSALWDRRVAELREEYRIVYDLIDETYDLFDVEGLLESELDPPEITERMSAMPFTPLVEESILLSSQHYYVTVEVEVQPLSVEEVRDLERWLSGSLRGGSGLGRISSQVIGLFKSQVGLGERRRGARSADFEAESVNEMPFDADG